MTELEKLVTHLKEEHGDRWRVKLLHFALTQYEINLLRVHVPGLVEALEQMVQQSKVEIHYIEAHRSEFAEFLKEEEK